MARQPRRQRQLPRLTLLLCLLALSSGAHAQGIFDMLAGVGTGNNVNGDAGTTTTTAPAAGAGAANPATPAAAATPTPSPAAPAAAATPTPSPAAPAAAATPTPSPAAATTTTPAPAAAAPAAPAATPSPAGATPTTATPAPSGFNTNSSTALNAGKVTAGTPPVNTTAGSDAAAVAANGTVGTVVSAPSGDTLPPSPPAAWAAMQKDCQLVFNVEIRGKYIIPFTSPKAKVIARVLKDRYLRTALLPDISVAALSTFTYLSYDNPTDADPLPSAPTTTVGRRRLAHVLGGASRDLLQLEKSGAELKIIVATNAARVDSEIRAFEDGVESGAMAQDFTLAGIDTENLTMLATPYTEDLIGPGNTQEGGNSSFKAWIIAVIVGVILIVVPVPAYLLVRWRKRKNKEAAAIQAAEAEVARQRMQSRIMRPGSKSFSLKPGGSTADIMVRSGSIGGLAGFHNNGRLQSWSGSPERQYGQAASFSNQLYGLSRQTSVTSMGSALPSARSYGAAANAAQAQRTPSRTAGPSPAAVPIHIPAGAYEEELEIARTARSERGA